MVAEEDLGGVDQSEDQKSSSNGSGDASDVMDAE